MSDNAAPFELVRRGYEPSQVDRRIQQLARELDAARRQVSELSRKVEQVQNEKRAAEEQLADSAPSYSGLGARIEKILGLAEEEAAELLSKATQEADQNRKIAEQAGEKVRTDADRFATERRSAAEAEAAKVIEDAKRQADRLRDEAERDATARREEAEALFEQQRAKAARAAADFETTLAHRREQASATSPSAPTRPIASWQPCRSARSSCGSRPRSCAPMPTASRPPSWRRRSARLRTS
jgi:cell division septum initiation protein DivIVA